MNNVIEFKKKIPIDWYYYDTSPFEYLEDLERYVDNYVVIFPPGSILQACGVGESVSLEDFKNIAKWLNIKLENKKLAHIKTELLWKLKKKLEKYKSPKNSKLLTPKTLIVPAHEFPVIDDDTFTPFVEGILLHKPVITCGIDYDNFALDDANVKALILDTLAIISKMKDDFYDPKASIYLSSDWHSDSTVYFGINLKENLEWLRF